MVCSTSVEASADADWIEDIWTKKKNGVEHTFTKHCCVEATMDLNEIAIFVRVARTLSFSEAARQLGVPTSTISRAVARLEESLGVRLVQRSTRKLSLTAEGESYLDSVGPALQAVERTRSPGRAKPYTFFS